MNIFMVTYARAIRVNGKTVHVHHRQDAILAKDFFEAKRKAGYNSRPEVVEQVAEDLTMSASKEIISEIVDKGFANISLAITEEEISLELKEELDKLMKGLGNG